LEHYRKNPRKDRFLELIGKGKSIIN